MKQGRIIGAALATVNGGLILLCAFLYFLKDRQAPEFTFKAVETVYREGIETEELLKGAAAWDVQDGDLSSRIVIEKISENREAKTAVVFYAVSDRAGNAARASRVFSAVFADQNEEREGDAAGQFQGAGIAVELKEGLQNLSASPTPTGRPTPAPSLNPEPEEPLELEGTPEPGGTPEPERTQEPERMQEPETMPVPTAEAEPLADASVPVLSLKVSEVEIKAGQGPAWVELIGTLSDDKDSYETLFRNLNVSRYDRNKPGAYQVNVSTQDSDGNQSEAVPLTIIVK